MMSILEWSLFGTGVLALGFLASMFKDAFQGMALTVFKAMFHSVFARFNYDGAYFWSLLEEPLVSGSRVLWQQHSMKHDGTVLSGGSSKFRPNPGPSRFVIWKGIPLLLSFTEKEKTRTTLGDLEHGLDASITLLAIHRHRFIEATAGIEKNRYSKESANPYLEVMIHDGSRWHHRDIIPRSWANVYIDPEPCEKITQWVKYFVNNKEEWSARGVPYRTGIMLEGPPGTGKTSLVQALANEIGYGVKVLNLSEMGNLSLRNAISGRSRNASIYLIEDLSAIWLGDQKARVKPKPNPFVGETIQVGEKGFFTQTTNEIVTLSGSFEDMGRDIEEGLASGFLVEEEEGSSGGVTLDGLLNAVDGILSPEGCIFIYTANEKLALDEALTRPGRIDLIVRIDYASRLQISKMFQTFFPDDAMLSDHFAQCFPERVYSMAEIQDVLLKTRRSARAIQFAEEHVKGITSRLDLRSIVSFDPS